MDAANSYTYCGQLFCRACRREAQRQVGRQREAKVTSFTAESTGATMESL
jgi:hypothetical protein